jgi:putative MATE family efflux protein
MRPPPSLLAASRARQGYGIIVQAAPQTPEPSLDRQILGIAAPSLLALALDPVLAAVDVAFVGRCGENSGAIPLAAVAASTGFFGLVFSATNCFASAGTPLVARARVDEGEAAALRLGGAVVRAALVVGLVLCLFSEAVAPQAMALFAPPGLLGASVAFTRLRGLSAPAIVGAAALNGVLRGVGDPNAALEAAALAALINVVLDVVLVWQLGMNPNGAAVATACAEWAAVLYLGLRFAKRSEGVESEGLFRGLETFKTAALATLVRTLCLQAFLAATTSFIALQGADPTLLAAHLVLKQFYIILAFVTDALAVAAQQLVASASTTEEARARSKRLLTWGFVTGAVLAGLLYVLPPSLLTDDPRVAAEASAELLRIVAPLQLLSSLVFVGDGIMQGSRDFKYEAGAVALAAAGGFAVLFLEQRPPDGALATAWDAVAVLNALRFATFVGRFYVRGPLVGVSAPEPDVK